MNKLALNFIFKNEAHVIERMLNSNLDLVDVIVCVDTGSTDNTVKIIKDWAKINRVPTYIYYRLFDQYDNSRNFALHKLEKVIHKLEWNLNETYGYWLDCDEVILHNNFKKTLQHDAYLSEICVNNSSFSRLTFFKLNISFYWYGPVHEYLKSDEHLDLKLVENFKINVYNDGNSWQDSLTVKYLNHANILEEHLQKANVKDEHRWLFYLAQSYYFSAFFTNNNEDRSYKFNKALQAYNLRMDIIKGGNIEELFYSQYKIGHISYLLKLDWNIVLKQYKKALSVDHQRGEPLFKIISYYFENRDYALAYKYSKKSLKLYHEKNPFPNKLLFIEAELYNWKFLYTHIKVCIKLNNLTEAKVLIKKLNKLIYTNSKWFNLEDKIKIKEINQFLSFFK